LTRLYHAIHADDDNNVQGLLSDKQMLQSKNIREFLSLHAAAKHGHESVVEAFLENGAEIDSKNEYSKTALMVAAWEGHISVVKLLLENGADINSKINTVGQHYQKQHERTYISGQAPA
jgi:ankyrin repeat protein